MKYHLILLALLSLPVTTWSATVEPCPDGSGPRTAVMNYLRAMHEHRFDEAFDFVTERMTDGRSRDDWAALQAAAYGPGAVDIYGVDPRPAVATPTDQQCDSHAVVPNLLSARDRLNTAGAVEFEVYTVVKSDGTWRIDAQETLFDDAAIRRWFPAARSFVTE